MGQWSENALTRLSKEVMAERQRSEALLRNGQIVEPAHDYWARLVSSIRENLAAFCAGFAHKTQAAWDGEQLYKRELFCLRADDTDNIYLTHGGAVRTE